MRPLEVHERLDRIGETMATRDGAAKLHAANGRVRRRAPAPDFTGGAAASAAMDCNFGG